MIEVTRLNGEKLFVSPHQIEFLEKTPDTVVSMVSGRKMMVKESPEQVIERVIQYRRKLGPINQEL